MPDTLVDDHAPPPTIRDDTLAAPCEAEPPRVEVEPPPPPRRSRARLVLVALASLFTLLLVAAFAVYALVWRYEPVALQHIPGNANLALRIDAPKILLFGPVRRRLVPLLFEPQKSTRAGKSLAQRIDDATGVDLRTDAREIVIASVDGASWVAILGGRIKPGRFVKGLSKLARDEAWPGGFRLDGELLVGRGLVIGQADDGAIVVGSDRDIVSAALPASSGEDAARLELDTAHAISFAAGGLAWSGAAHTLSLGHASVLGHIERASGHLTLADSPELVVHMTPAKGSSPAELARDFGALLGELRMLALLLPDVAGENRALADATVEPSGDRVTLVAPWPMAGLERGADKLAGLLGTGGGGLEKPEMARPLH